MATAYVVTAGCVVAKVASDTGEGYFYQGAFLPDGVSEKEKERLVDIGLVAEVEVEVVDPSAPEPLTGEPNPLEGMKLAQLRDYATEKDISLDGVDLRKVDEIRAAITKAEQS